jgi:vacuolar-type H+-ATPase subunit F/Vma7
MEYIVIGLSSFIAGFILSGIFKIHIKISKKEDFDAKTKELNKLIEEFAKEKVVLEYRKEELFPADLNKDYGIPRDLR